MSAPAGERPTARRIGGGPPAGEELSGKAYDAQLMARMWTFVRPHRRLIAIALVLIPVAVAFEVAQPYLLKLAIDRNIARHSTDGLGALAIVFMGCVLLQALASYGQLYALQLLGQRSMHDLRQATYRHVLTRRMAFFDQVPVGRLLTRMTNDVESINEMFAAGVVTLVADLLKLVAIVGMMLYLDVGLTLITFAALPVLVVVVDWSRRVMRRSFRAIRAQLAALNSFAQEHLSGIKVVQLFGRAQVASRSYQAINLAHRDAYLGSIRADAAMYAVVEAIGIGSAAAIAWHAGGRIGQGALTVGLVVAFVEYVNKFYIPVRDFSAKYTVMQSAMAATERIVALLDTEEPDTPARPGAAASSADRSSSVSFDGVRFAYRDGDDVLQGVSLEVAAGETVAIVGATGSGKSTLVRLLGRLYEPQAGHIAIGGRPLDQLPPDELRRRVTFVSQDVFLFAGTVADNVRLGRPEATDAAVQAALARVGADRMLERRGAGPDTLVVERGANFSAGERQLIAFARALVRDPEILVLDEATAHVDPDTEAAIERALAILMQGRTTLVIAHRLSTIRSADRIAVMARGQIAELGTRDELIAHGGVYAQLERSFARSD
jgi:ATP-binding cassette, subfamily B, multidrug efflux pump